MHKTIPSGIYPYPARRILRLKTTATEAGAKPHDTLFGSKTK